MKVAITRPSLHPATSTLPKDRCKNGSVVSKEPVYFVPTFLDRVLEVG